MFTGQQVVALFRELGITHVVSIPDSTIGRWDEALSNADGLQLIRVCREGEAWAVAGGLYLGGATPLVLIQCTGLFESGDALRNIVHDWHLPIFSMIGYRSYLNQDTLPGDTCLVFTEPILDAWKIPYKLITDANQIDVIRAHYRECLAKGTAGAALLAEGKA
ncbi:MAG TPA: thiamine pyrophosphate-binding protein [Gemmatimonadaceae bacterium]|nr:thiamine pyrophosphate-binding protein [Gemmatimonadaceae bacterium]